MYVFNKITVNPQLPKRIEELEKIANNLWWSWNTEFLRLFKQIDRDLWETVEKNPVKFLKLVAQEKLEEVSQNPSFLKAYDKIVENFEAYQNSKSTWFSRNYPENKNDLIAYFSAEYGLDQILSIYSGGLGILSGDHLKSASDLGIPLVAVGLLYKNGYFHQKINGYGDQETEYRKLDISSLPIKTVKDVEGKDLILSLKFPKRKLYLKVWQIQVGRVNLYLMDSDIEENHEEYRKLPIKSEEFKSEYDLNRDGLINNDDLNYAKWVIDIYGNMKYDNTKSDNPLIKYIMETTNNSRNKDEKSAKYKILLTQKDIQSIRKYNDSTKYDDYDLKCINGYECKSTFLENLKKGTLYKPDGNFIGNVSVLETN